ncbi:hypothetical protein RJ640_019402 [Escallonia rubra]|uniref:Peptidase C1A papain C-terminal domain-containing protein n=1 Tax=Escallonia rubra TaxID=112253 RepID=A0AA88QL43_9ASTE|nr:hypothetical protein RJ640_019402 [Escallonia rubra]
MIDPTTTISEGLGMIPGDLGIEIQRPSPLALLPPMAAVVYSVCFNRYVLQVWGYGFGEEGFKIDSLDAARRVQTKIDSEKRLAKGRKSDRYAPRAGDSLPESVDWRAKGAVAPVKDQGSCGELLLPFSSRRSYHG